MEIPVKVNPEKFEEPEPVKSTFRKPITPEQRRKNVQEEFKKELGRDITDQELDNYLILYDKEETNFWEYVKKLQG
jgi:hypothetical protein